MMGKLSILDKKFALEWLVGLKSCLAEVDPKIKWWLTCGTLLGAVRGGDFIDWDVDIDCMMLREHEDKFPAIVACLRKHGYTANYVIVSDLRPQIKELQHFIQITRKGIPGHIGVRRPKDFKTKNCLTRFKTATIQGVEFPIPNNVDKYLTEMYGDWRTPKPRKGWKAMVPHVRSSGHPVPEGAWHD